MKEDETEQKEPGTANVKYALGLVLCITMGSFQFGKRVKEWIDNYELGWSLGCFNPLSNFMYTTVYEVLKADQGKL